jgi:hypothetical protein
MTRLRRETIEGEANHEWLRAGFPARRRYG